MRSSARRRLALNVIRLRIAAQFTQQAAADAAGLHIRQWQKVEGQETNATLETIARMAAALDVDIWELLRPPTRIGGSR